MFGLRYAGPAWSAVFCPVWANVSFVSSEKWATRRAAPGLGLAIVKHVVNRHRGGLLVESQPGKGSAFAAYVELAEQD